MLILLMEIFHKQANLHSNLCTWIAPTRTLGASEVVKILGFKNETSIAFNPKRFLEMLLFYLVKWRRSNLHHTRVITPERVTSA